MRVRYVSRLCHRLRPERQLNEKPIADTEWYIRPRHRAGISLMALTGILDRFTVQKA
jgi:hypothetical protein